MYKFTCFTRVQQWSECMQAAGWLGWGRDR